MLHMTKEHILNPKVDTPLFATNANPLQLSQGKNLAFEGTVSVYFGTHLCSWGTHPTDQLRVPGTHTIENLATSLCK